MVRARDPGRRRLLPAAAVVVVVVVGARLCGIVPDQAVREDKGPLVRTHLLRGVVSASEAPHGELRVAALDGGRDAVGELVRAVKVDGLDDGLPRRAGPPASHAAKVLGRRLLGPVDGARLASVLLCFHAVDCVGRVLELLEPGHHLGVPDGLGPFVKVAGHQALHLRFQRGADAELVVEDHLPEVLDAAGEALEPSCRALELVCRADVEHEVAVEDGDHVCGRHVLGEELRVLGLGTAVAGDEDVEPLLCSDETEAADL